MISEMFDEAERRDPKREHRWVVVVDGSDHQLKTLRAEARRRKVQVDIVLDVIHVAGYLWDAAKALFGGGESDGAKAKRKGWVNEKLRCVLAGQSGYVVSSLSQVARRKGLSQTGKEDLKKAKRYLHNHRAQLRYPAWLAAGVPIASGVIEGACRFLVKDRMDITGARWGLDTAEAVLQLRALTSSGDLDEYWGFYEGEELANNFRHYPEFFRKKAA